MKASVISMAILATLAAATPMVHPNTNEAKGMEKKDTMNMEKRATGATVDMDKRAAGATVDMEKRDPIQPVDPDDQSCNLC